MTFIQSHPVFKRFQRFRKTAVDRIAWPYSPEEDRFVYWRAQMLFSIFSAALILGSLALVSAIALIIRQNVWGLAVVDVSGFVVCLTLLLVPRITYEVRTAVALLMCYAVGMAVVLSVGPLSGGPAWLFAFPILTGVLLGTRQALLAIALNAVSLSLVLWLIQTHAIGKGFPFFTTPQAMVAAFVNFMVADAIAAISVAALVKGLVSSYDREKGLKKNLQQERADLLAAKSALEAEITGHKETEAALRESEETYRSFVDNAPMAMYTIDTMGNFTYGNKKLLEITGYTREDWRNKPFHPIVHPDDLPVAVGKVEKRIRGEGESTPYEIRIRHASGAIMWVEIISESIFSKNAAGEKTLVGMQSFVTDITQRKSAEQALRQSEEKYRHLFELESDAIFLVDKETGRILEVNESAVGMYGYSRQELLEMKNVDLSAEPDRTKQATHDQLSQIPIRYHRKNDGTVIPVEITASHLTWNGREAHIAAIRDISFRIESENERTRLEKELYQARKMESIGTLAGGIAHDFNNILYVIIGNAELVLEDLPKWNPLYPKIDDIKVASLRAAGIVRQLLDFSRPTAQELKPIGAVPIIESAIRFLRSTIPATITIRKRLPDREVTILGDPTQIDQMLMNICTNASQAMGETGGIIDIDVETMHLSADEASGHPGIGAGEHLRIGISDTGPGIDPEIIDRIFDPYFTTRDVGGGSGMGLSVVRGIVQNHKGAITVENRPDKGARFAIFLPVSGEVGVPEPAEADELPGGDERILLVDDEAFIVDMVGEMLQRLGYRVQTHMNPLEAVEQFAGAPRDVDLVITDMTMPQMTGARLSERVKAIRSDIPVIICTGHSALIDEQKAMDIGIAAYVAKPIRMKNLARTVRAVLDNRPEETPSP